MDITMEIAKSLLSQGPIVGLLFWLLIQNNSRIDKKDNEISSLNKEMRDSLEKNLNKTNEAIVNNTTALNAFKEALVKNV